MHANEAGADDKDITILVRTNKEGAAVASFLSSKGRKVISPLFVIAKRTLSAVPYSSAAVALPPRKRRPKGQDALCLYSS